MIPHGVRLFFQDEAVIEDPSLYQPAGDPRGIVVDLVLLQLFRSRGRQGMGQEEGAARGQAGGGDLHNAAAVHLAHNALAEHLLGGVPVAHEGRILFEEVGEAVGAEAHPPAVRDTVVPQGLLGVEEQGVGVGLGGGLVVGIVVRAGGQGQGAEHIGVVFRHHHFPNLPGQGLSGVHGHLGLVFVSPVNDEAEGPVPGDGQLLDAVLQILGGAIAGGAAAGVVGEGDRGDGVDVDGADPPEGVLTVQSQGGLGGLIEALVHFAGIFAGKIHIGHCLLPSFLKSG